jgi:hypothetical protein
MSSSEITKPFWQAIRMMAKARVGVGAVSPLTHL